MIKSGEHNGIVCTLTDVRPHPNADRMLIASALGYNVIVSLDSKDGDIGVVFSEGLKLSHEYLMANNAYRKDPITGDKMGGFFEATGRVKAIKLRGQFSEAYFAPLTSLEFAGDHKFKVGDEFCSVNKIGICEKYFTKATIRAMKNAERKYKKPRFLPSFLVPMHKKYVISKVKFDPCPDFKQHMSTTKLRQYTHMIPDDLVAIITSKKHGTSGRTGLVKWQSKSWHSFITKRFGSGVSYQKVTGTRKVVKNPFGYGKSTDDGYYAGTDFRQQIHNNIVGLKKDEIIYYEILGFSGPATSIMPNHALKWSDFKGAGFSKEEFNVLTDTFGETITYHYGNGPGEFSVEVYRIVQNGKDLSDVDMRKRYKELNLQPVKFLAQHTSSADLMDISKRLSEIQDDGGQLREGVVIRLESPEGDLVKLLKFKSAVFCLMEGIKRNDVDYVDQEEIS